MSQPPVMAPEPATPPEPPPPTEKRTNWVLVVAVVVAVAILAVVGAVLTRSEPPPEPAPLSAPGGPYQETLELTQNDLNNYWSEEMPEVYGVEYDELRHGVIAFTSSDPPPACGPDPITYQDMAGNAYYCPPQTGEPERDVASGDYIAYDDESLFPALAEPYGGAGVAAILAHEWGHAIQSRAEVSGETVELELQADCFAGSWLRRVFAASSPHHTFSVGDAARASAALLTFRDPPGTDPTSETAHGNGFDRVAAFQTGFLRGATQCATFPGTVVVTADVFTDVEDFVREGNSPLAKMPGIVLPELDTFWAQAYAEAFEAGGSYEPIANLQEFTGGPPACQGGAVPLPVESHASSFYCPATDTLAWNLGGTVAELYGRIGDSVVAVGLSDRWGYGMRYKAGQNLEGREVGLSVDCTTGAFFRDAEDRELLSPGDLDEAVATLLATSLVFDLEDYRGDGFTRVGAFRSGYEGGVGVCTEWTEREGSDSGSEAGSE